MWTKLAFQNVRKGMKDYAVYFFTLVLAVCIFYLFNSIHAQEAMLDANKAASKSMEMLSSVIAYCSIFVSVILGFLVVYANNFFMKRRKKELGVYLTLGMRRGVISMILILETSLLAVIALAAGIVSGVFLSQFMSVFTAKIFEVNMTKYTFLFSAEAALKSILYFGIIFVIVMIFNTISVSKLKLIDLIYGAKKNEQLKIRNTVISCILFMGSIGLLGGAYGLVIKYGIFGLMERGNQFLLLMCGLGVLGTLLFFYSVAGILTRVVEKSDSIYYKNLNLFVMRQFSSKINTNFVTVSLVSIIIMLTATIFSGGYSMQRLFAKEVTRIPEYDYSYYYFYGEDESLKTDQIMDRLPEELVKSEYIDTMADFTVYKGSPALIEHTGLDSESTLYFIVTTAIEYVGESEYNRLAAAGGYPQLELEKGTFTMIDNSNGVKAESEDWKPLYNGTITFMADGQEYHYQDYGKLANVDSGMSYNNAIIVPDEIIRQLQPTIEVLKINCKNQKANDAYFDLWDDYNSNAPYEERGYTYATSKILVEADAITMQAMVAFLAIYLGIVFMISAAAILAIQQLSEAADNKKRYELLLKLGTEKKMMDQALFAQIGGYFLAPLLLGTVHSIVGIYAVSKTINSFGGKDVVGSITLSAVVILLLYGVYFVMTYLGCKNVIYKK